MVYMSMTNVNHSLSKEEIFFSAPELEVCDEYSEEEEEEVLKETLRSPI
jgi:hypothetical protein